MTGNMAARPAGIAATSWQGPIARRGRHFQRQSRKIAAIGSLRRNPAPDRRRFAIGERAVEG
jgi:hypothetical protein